MKINYKSIIIVIASNLLIFITTYYLSDQLTLLLLITAGILIISVWSIYMTSQYEVITNTQPDVERRLSQRDIFSNHQNNLLKRVQFSDMLKHAIEQANHLNKKFAILLVNLEPTYSHEKHQSDFDISNMHMTGTINHLKSMLKPEDTLAYINNDELVILISDLDKPKLAGNIAQRIIDHFARPHVIKGESLIVKATVGIAIYPTNGATIDEIIENAQKALHKAKVSGKQLIQYHISDVQSQHFDQKNMQALFKLALKKHQIQLLFQPIFDLEKGDVTSVQALLRWEHPQLGIISPELFIKTAEETNSLAYLSEWVLREACEKIKYWEQLDFGSINVLLKISPSQFLLPTFPKILEHVLIQLEVNPSCLHLSISESVIMNNIEVTSKILEAISLTGVTIGIDHFGSSYTSLSHIDKLPIKYITMDKSLITLNPKDSSHTRTMVNAVIALGKEFGFKTIAEGVETADQLDYLINHQCDKALGYLLSYPVIAEKINYQFNKVHEPIMDKK